MVKRLPLALSATALLVALFGSTPVGETAANLAHKVVPRAKTADYAKNAGAVGGIKASRTPKAGFLVPLGKDGEFPASVGVAGPAGPPGQQGPPGPEGPAGSNAGLTGVPAGGALAGTYPNPTLAANAVTTSALANGAVTAAKLAPNTVAGDKVQDGSLTLADVAFASGKVLMSSAAGISAHTCYTQDVAVAGGKSGDTVLFVKHPATSSALVGSASLIAASGEFEFSLCNVKGGSFIAIGKGVLVGTYIALKG